MTPALPLTPTPTAWREYFEELAASGDPIRAGGYSNAGVPVTHAQMDLVAEDVAGKLRLGAQDTLLDVGCGAGLLLDRLRPRCAAATGVDFAAGSLRICAANAHRILQADALRLPFADGAFDRALCHCMFMCMPSAAFADSVLEELVRVTRPGGLVLIGDVPDHDLRELYWSYSQKARLPRLWPLRRAWRRGQELLGLTDTGFATAGGAADWNYSMFPAWWFHRWAAGQATVSKVETIRWRRPGSGRGTDATRYDVRLTIAGLTPHAE